MSKEPVAFKDFYARLDTKGGYVKTCGCGCGNPCIAGKIVKKRGKVFIKGHKTVNA